MKNQTIIYWTLLLILSLVLTACTQVSTPEGTLQPENQATEPVADSTVPVPTKTPRPEARQVINPENSGELTLVNVLGKGNITDFDWLPDGRRVVVGAGYGIYIYDGQSLQNLMFIDTGSYITAVVYSPDGSIIFSGGPEIQLWDSQSGQELGSFTGSAGTATYLALSPDGKTMASSGSGGTIHLWDTDTQTELSQLARHPPTIHGLVFSPDGTSLASAAVSSSHLSLPTPHPL